ncbi:DUF3784 domain-containing protein [Oceanobacillus sp. 143]|uniref:DUF3784 domain-containing protein n=1 Tax=Oceanobacillus zhaokaii TaxID=2052660 RepID=A0A345PMF3_9BACI|nr:hypothetical protein CUC15_13930 [Oceanobacillus zhaokaii]QGS69936.1 DUF3784 domain-containing protein [Oceanobacillus sp. 143]
MTGTVIGMVLFVGFGIILSSGRGSSLIAGFNTLPQEEKDKYDSVALCKFMGKVMFALSSSMILWVLSEVYEINWLLVLGIILFIGIVVFSLIYANTGNRFKK